MANTTLLKPTTIEAVVDEKNPNLAVITLEPFERGYGHTLGNALRRILLASMVGYEDSSYFARTFKKRTGMTPTQYRKEAAKAAREARL